MYISVAPITAAHRDDGQRVEGEDEGEEEREEEVEGEEEGEREEEVEGEEEEEGEREEEEERGDVGIAVGEIEGGERVGGSVGIEVVSLSLAGCCVVCSGRGRA